MCGVDFTVYDLIPAGAAFVRALWVKHSTPLPSDRAGGGAAGVPSESQPVTSDAASLGLGDPVGYESVHTELDRLAVPAVLDDPGVDAEPLLVGR
jgi:hypothetical protein